MHSLTKPEYMTEDLAFIIGCLVSEGCLNETPRGHYVHFCNSDIKLMNKYIQCMSNVFNIRPAYSVRNNVGKSYTINGVSGTIKKKVYYSCLGSKTLVKWFRELGLHYSVKSGPKQDSWNKVVPWSILQADFKAQRAYLAAYIEGDGSVDREGIRIHSRSMELLKQTQILIMSHGYLSRIKEARTCNTLTVLKAHAVLLFKDIQKYMISKTNINSSSFSNIGVPTDFVIRIFDERRLSRFEFKNDEGDVVKVQGFRHYFKSNGIKHISHDSLTYPIVQKVLDHLKIISKSTYDKLVDLLDQSYYFSKVSDIQYSDKKVDVYDLSIDNRYDPSFTANGMIVHNCVIMYQLKSTLEVNKDQRYDIKAITFGRIYGKISISYAKPKSEGGLGKTEEECEQITTNFDNTFKIGTDWLGEQHEKGKSIIGVESPLGMFRHLDGYLHTRPAIINAMNRRGPNCVDLQTQCLSENGWKFYHELKVGDKIYTKNVNTGDLELQPIKELTSEVHKGKMFRLNGTIDALTTPNHRWLIDKKVGRKKVNTPTMVHSEYLANSKNNNAIHLTADRPIEQKGNKWSNKEIRLLGWILTDGYYCTGKDKRIGITQSSRGNPHKVVKIDQIIQSLGIEFGRTGPDANGKILCRFSGSLADKIKNTLPNKIITIQFLQDLSTKQLKLLYKYMMMGNGNYNFKRGLYENFGAGTKKKAEAFSMLCVLLGISHNLDVIAPNVASKKYDSMPNIPNQTKKFWTVEIKQRHRAQPMFCSSWVDFDDRVWCPTVDNGTFIAKRNNSVYVTGNSMIQGTSSHVGVTAIRSIQKIFWHFWVKHDIPVCYDAVTNYVHDAIESHCPISFLPVYLYIKYHAMTTLVHRRFNKVFGYNFRVGLEAEGIIGGALSECKEEYAWNFDWPSLEESIDKTLKFHQETLGYEYSNKELKAMKADAKHNWDIVSALRLKELKESVKSPKANTLMLMNENNARDMGLRIEGMDGVVRTVG